LFPPEKIDEWILEVSERPSSAPIIIQYIANRLRDLTEWNERLRVENIELRSGKRVEEYERTISHLEYQLDMLKRQVSGKINLDALEAAPVEQKTLTYNLLVYGPGGRVARAEIDPELGEDGALVCSFSGFEDQGDEPPRMQVVHPTDELMFTFTSGRIISLPVSGLPLSKEPDSNLSWSEAYVPEEPNLGETLASIVPVSRMAMADFFLQVSRRGYTKKIRTALASTIMDSKFIGTGIKVPADQAMTIKMGLTDDAYVLVSYRGYLQYIHEEMLPYAIVEAMRLSKNDHLVAAFPTSDKQAIIAMTQIGKVIHRTADSLETATTLARKGTMLYSTARRDAGVCVVGASSVNQGDLSLVLHSQGKVTMHTVKTLIGKGSIPVFDELLDFATFPGLEEE
jgi:hypothetical protein